MSFLCACSIQISFGSLCKPEINRSQSAVGLLTDRSASKHPNITSTPHSEHTSEREAVRRPIFVVDKKHREYGWRLMVRETALFSFF